MLVNRCAEEQSFCVFFIVTGGITSHTVYNKVIVTTQVCDGLAKGEKSG
jgi:uncharacterized protein YgbK (DUF1537 family)